MWLLRGREIAMVMMTDDGAGRRFRNNRRAVRRSLAWLSTPSWPILDSRISQPWLEARQACLVSKPKHLSFPYQVQGAVFDLQSPKYFGTYSRYLAEYLLPREIIRPCWALKAGQLEMLTPREAWQEERRIGGLLVGHSFALVGSVFLGKENTQNTPVSPTAVRLKIADRSLSPRLSLKNITEHLQLGGWSRLALGWLANGPTWADDPNSPLGQMQRGLLGQWFRFQEEQSCVGFPSLC